jgi:hypothetical protein
MENIVRTRSSRTAISVSLAIVLHLVWICAAANAEPVPGRKNPPIRLSWKENILTVFSDQLPKGQVQIWYLEAFCRSGSTDREWEDTVIPHKTLFVTAQESPTFVHLRSEIEGGVVVDHTIAAGRDAVDFRMLIKNNGLEFVDVQWGQPCIRVADFTGKTQDDYPQRCFIVTEKGVQTLDKVERTGAARYKGGQIYVPRGINLDDVNPRPLSPVRPAENIIGCFSADDKLILAMAWDNTQELFQGVITCIHSDFRIGGLKPGEEKRLRGRLYIVPNDTAALLARYRQDFPPTKE